MTDHITPARITSLARNEIFVFGSNLQGIHGAGAAKQALRWGAVLGQGEGLRGNTYAIPTKVTPWQQRSLEDIQDSVWSFLDVANGFPCLKFLVTEIGCGLAGYMPPQIAPMFMEAAANVRLPQLFLDVLAGKYQSPPEKWPEAEVIP